MTVKLESYNKNWPILFALEKAKLLAAIGPWVEAIEHIGSTSIPFMTAKPTIDIALGVSSLEIAEQHIIAPLIKQGYQYNQALEKTIPERRLFGKFSSTGDHLVHVHVLIVNNELWKNHLRFKNYLMAHSEEAKNYILLKESLKEKFAHDREAYTLGKSEFIKEILSKAQQLEF